MNIVDLIAHPRLFADSNAGYLRRMIADTPIADDSPPLPAPQLLTVREAAKALSISERSLWALTDAGHIAAVRMGRAVRYDTQDLRRWIEKNKSVGGDFSAAD